MDEEDEPKAMDVNENDDGEVAELATPFSRCSTCSLLFKPHNAISKVNHLASEIHASCCAGAEQKEREVMLIRDQQYV